MSSLFIFVTYLDILKYNLRLAIWSINVLSNKNHDAKGVRNPYENRETTPCSMNTRSFIFFTRILARAQISSLTSEGFFIFVTYLDILKYDLRLRFLAL